MQRGRQRAPAGHQPNSSVGSVREGTHQDVVHKPTPPSGKRGKVWGKERVSGAAHTIRVAPAWGPKLTSSQYARL